MNKNISHYTFIGGVIIAVVLGLFSTRLPETSSFLLSIILLALLIVIIGIINALPEIILKYDLMKIIVLEQKQLKKLIDNTLIIYVGSTATIILSKYFFQNDNLSLLDLLIFSREVFIIVALALLLIYILMICSFLLFYMVRGKRK